MNNTSKTIMSATAAVALIGSGILLYNNESNSNTKVNEQSNISLEMPSLEIPSLEIPSLEMPSLEMSSLEAPVISVNKINIPDNDLNEWMQFSKKISSSFIDNRMVFYDKKVIYTNKIMHEWLEIYNNYKNVSEIKYIPINKKFRMITEIRTPNDYKELKILAENLKYYKSEGYDSVLYGFTPDDNLNDILNTIQYVIQNFKMNVWLTYTGSQVLTDTVFMSPEKYSEILKASAPYISGYVNSWRRTSAHLWKQDDAFMNYTNYILRKANPNLPIIGELYFGNTYKFQGEGNVGFEMNNFKNSSGIMIVNFGFKKINIKYLFDKILKPYIGNVPRIACVVGDKPYYLYVDANGYDYKENMKLKHQVEQEFFKNGCIGVITLSDDGRKLDTNNLSKTLYSQLNSVK